MQAKATKMTEEIELWKGKCSVYLFDPQTKGWGPVQQTNIGVYQNKKDSYFRIVALGIADGKAYINSIMSETWKYTYIKSNFGQFHDSKNLYGLSWTDESQQVNFVSICFKVRDAIPLVMEDEIRRQEWEFEKQQKAEEEKRKKEEAERRRKEEEARKKQEEEDRKRREEEERLRREEEERRKKEEEEKKRREDQELKNSFGTKVQTLSKAIEALSRRIHEHKIYRSVEDVQKKISDTENVAEQMQTYEQDTEELKKLAAELKSKGMNVQIPLNGAVDNFNKLKNDLQNLQRTLTKELENQKKRAEELERKRKEEEEKKRQEEERRKKQQEILSTKNQIETSFLNRKKQQITEKQNQQKLINDKGAERTLKGQLEIAKWDIVNTLRDEKSELIQAIQEAKMKKKFGI